MSAALPAITEISKIVLRAVGGDAVAIIHHPDASETAQVVPIKDDLDFFRIGVESIPDKLCKGAQRVSCRRVPLEKILFGVQIECRHS